MRAEGEREQRHLRDHFLGAKVEKRDFASCLNYIFCAFQEKVFSTIALEETFCYVVMSGESRKRGQVLRRGDFLKNLERKGFYELAHVIFEKDVFNIHFINR